MTASVCYVEKHFSKGVYIMQAKGLSSGDTLRVELSDGTFDATVK